jgi:serine/threonine protein kinase HipA of HipAB toxin-antitoxin module
MFRDGLYPDWPWFLDDLRPQGFLGRLFARRCAAEMALPADQRSWTADDVLAGLLRHGTDLPGAFVVGEAAMERVLARRLEEQGVVPRADIGPEYARLAEMVLEQEWPGSSAAGEQPKFTACVEESPGVVRQVIVKFSGLRPEDVRWADLLVCEHLASEVLRAHGMTAAQTALHRHAGRTFLESVRFDRAGRDGRRGVVSLAALDAAWFGEADTSWVDAAERLRREGWLPGGPARELSVRWWFGRLIGNTDMHFGNVALFLSRQRPFALAPVYDMLPMAYRPGLEGRVGHEPLPAVLPTPGAAEFFAAAVEPASRFWQAVADDTRVSPGFRELAARNADVVERCRAEAGVVPATGPVSES